jgi:hypothetical protein
MSDGIDREGLAAERERGDAGGSPRRSLYGSLLCRIESRIVDTRDATKDVAKPGATIVRA